MMRLTIVVTVMVLLVSALATRADDLVGKLGGVDWKGAFVMVKKQTSTKLTVNVYAKPVKGMQEEFMTPHLILTVPKKNGAYDTDSASVTFFTPPGENKISTNKKIVLKATDAGTSITVDAKFDDDNWAKGICTIETTK